MQRLKALQAQEDATPAEGGGEASQELEPEPAE
jgi:hypothetical protein